MTGGLPPDAADADLSAGIVGAEPRDVVSDGHHINL